jgi:hypothetical protein
VDAITKRPADFSTGGLLETDLSPLRQEVSLKRSLMAHAPEVYEATFGERFQFIYD